MSEFYADYSLASYSTPPAVNLNSTTGDSWADLLAGITGAVKATADAAVSVVTTVTSAEDAIHNSNTATNTPQPKQPGSISPVMAIGIGILVAFAFKKLFKAG